MSSALDTADLLEAVRSGDGSALGKIMSRFYVELRHIAHRELSRRRPGQTLRTTALVHEAYLKLVGRADIEARDRAHFLALAAKTMRHVAIDYARKYGTRKRGGDWQRVSLDGPLPVDGERLTELIELDDALERLKHFDERMSAVVECRYFGGLTVRETALALDISPRSVDRTWQKAKAWLYREMHAP